MYALLFVGCDDGTADELSPDAAVDVVEASPDMASLDAGRASDLSVPDSQLDGAPDRAVGDVAAEPLDVAVDAALDAAVDAEPDLAADAALDVPAVPREIACFDGLDDDDDGRVDCADPDCRNTAACFDVREDCADGIDNTGDDHVDCADVTCAEQCPAPDVPAFTDDELQALMLARCQPCHVGGGNDGAMRLDPPFRDAIVNVASSQVPELRIKPGDRQASYLYRKVAYTFREVPGGGGEGMPPVEPLSRAELEQLGRWIEAL